MTDRQQAEARRQQEQAERARREGPESLLLSWNVEAKEPA